MATKAKTMSKADRKTPPSRKIEDKEQYERFLEFARKHDAAADPETFDRQFRKIVRAEDHTPRSSASSNKSINTRVSKK